MMFRIFIVALLFLLSVFSEAHAASRCDRFFLDLRLYALRLRETIDHILLTPAEKKFADHMEAQVRFRTVQDAKRFNVFMDSLQGSLTDGLNFPDASSELVKRFKKNLLSELDVRAAMPNVIPWVERGVSPVLFLQIVNDLKRASNAIDDPKKKGQISTLTMDQISPIVRRNCIGSWYGNFSDQASREEHEYWAAFAKAFAQWIVLVEKKEPSALESLLQT